ncbi:HEAT repeat domain-containing protein [Marinicella sp. S1101]|uniref:HEAT repeat domain-containing protein n=1 Tax=Marinicella marina TaxID=2996016 RepID=UPI002260AAFF|nr:HEAT repeat domain-containing protein [Marinicella marina]MCX7553358.1 HEAT repeat domain-containing protein [Marinicella marina]MDJ1139090.1 HEAT repeat domain-containing protein [Marinicella marina]
MRVSIKKITMLILLFSTPAIYGADKEATEAYEFGHAAMMSKDWNDAIGAFEQAAKERELKAAAKYWQAYSHYKIKQKAQAKRLLERLIKNHPESDWVDDAQVLLFEHGDGGENSSHQAALDEELKLFTLQQIMFNNPAKALPKIQAMLKTSESMRVKQNAIQLLGLSDSDEVVDYLFGFATSETNRSLKQQAIQMLSLRDSDKSREKLKKLYENSQDKEIKSAIIQGFIHHDDNDELISMLKQETDPELNHYLIQMLGIKGESAALKNLYKKSIGDSKRAIMEALALSGDASFLYEVIDSETDQEIKNQAIHSLIMVDDDNMGDYLAKLYKKAKNESEKDVISSVFIATDVDADVIVDILKSESSQGRKAHLINTLMAMDEVKALQSVYVDETDGEIKSQIIRHLGIMDATDVLMNMYKDDPSLANDDAFFEAFGMSSTELDEDFLMARFKEGDHQVKDGVLNALMMQDNSEVMVKLLKTETDHEIKKKIIQMIGMTNPDALIDAIED